MKAIVAMSGGVDSAVAAALLKEQGYQVSGVTMQIWNGANSATEGRHHGCYGPGEAEDIADARRVAQILDINFRVFDLKQTYRTEVLDYFCQEYLAGRTPNPCLRCNHKVKFEALFSQAQESGIKADFFATGHYARVEYDASQQRYRLKKARDLNKDQSYFISSLSQEQLGRSLFPIGDYTKAEVRRLASGFGLEIAEKPESQDFISGGYASLIATAPPGPILNKQGNILGEHRGLPFYTIGQRRGLGIAASEPLYVTDINPDENTVIVGNQAEVYRDELTASRLNWIAIAELDKPTRVSAKIRNLHQPAEATVTPLNRDRVHVKFEEPQKAITPGQAVVFYQEDVVLGGGTIERREE